MIYLLAWFPWVALAALMCVAWVFPTYFWLRLSRIPAAAALAAAPAVTSAVLLPVSIIYAKVGWFWSGARVLPLLGLLGGAGLVLFWNRPRRIGPARARYRLRFSSPSFILAAAVGWLLAALPTMLVAPPTNPPQQWDPSFHLNGVWGITKLGIAAPGEGLAHNMGGAPASGYPIGWHAFTSLFATPTTTVQASNASSLALMMIWVVGAAVYTHTLYPSRRATLAAAVIAGLLPSMPADALTAYSQWPNAMSVAFLPGGAVLAILTGRSLLRVMNVPTTAFPGSLHAAGDPVSALRSSSWTTTATLFAATLVATVGGIQAHQVYAFNLMFLLLAPVTIGVARVVIKAVRSKQWWLVLGTATVVVFALDLVVWVQLRPEVESMRNYPRYGVDVDTGLLKALVPNPPFTFTFGLGAYNVVVSLLLLMGLARIVLGHFLRSALVPWPGNVRPIIWPIWSFLTFTTLTFFAYGPDWSIRPWIVGPWFLDGRRVMEPLSLTLVPLVAVGFGWLVQLGIYWWNMSLVRGTAAQQRLVGVGLGAALLVASGGGALDSRIDAARSVLDPNNLGKPGMADQQTLDLIRTFPDILPEDAIVVGDPQAGAMYSQVIGQRWAYFPQLSLLNEDRDTQQVIVRSLGDLATNPSVCEAIETTGITHYLARPDGAYYGKIRSDRMPGLYNVDPSVGFELVAEAGQTRLYRITGCE